MIPRFEVYEDEGYLCAACGDSVFTQAKSLSGLLKGIDAAARCHFMPKDDEKHGYTLDVSPGIIAIFTESEPRDTEDQP